MKLTSSFGICYIMVNLINVNAYSIQPNELRFTATAVIPQLFEMLRGLIKNGDATNKIPILDPYVFDVKQIDLQDNYYSLQSNISDFTFTGMGNFLVEEQEFFKNEVAINVKLHFPVLKLEAEHYEMEGVVMEAIPIGGKGVMYFEIKDLFLYTKIYLRQSSNGKSILIDKLEKTNFTIGQILSRTEFDGNFDDILNAWIGDLFAEYLTRFNGFITATYKDNIISMLNSVLKAYDTWYILATILY